MPSSALPDVSSVEINELRAAPLPDARDVLETTDYQQPRLADTSVHRELSGSCLVQFARLS